MNAPGPSISAWTYHPGHTLKDDHYERLLGPNELGFYWDSVYQGTADTLQHAIVEISPSSSHSDIQSEENVRAAWIILKSRYPLLGARIEERPISPATATSLSNASQADTLEEEVFFVVDPARLSSNNPPHAHPKEVVFLSCASGEEANVLAEGIMNGFSWADVQTWQEGSSFSQTVPDAPSRLLSNILPACILFIRRTDCSSKFHVMIQAAHLITDGIANATILSEFLDVLSHGKNREHEVDATLGNKEMLEKRLRLSVSSESLYPDERPNYSRARRRWHRVLGKILLELRSAKIKGGHTLPRIIRPSTPYTPAKSAFITYAFSPAQTTNILRTCKQLGITFGNAHPILGQLAITRVLLRRRLLTLTKKRRGIPLSTNEDIDDEEWSYRRRQRMMTGGPLNLRPYLDQNWYSEGGAGNVCLSISYFFFALPFMPLGESGVLADSLSDDFEAGTLATSEIKMPSYDEMLSKERFHMRCKNIRKQSLEVFRHPRFLDVHAASLISMRVRRSRTAALMCRKDIPRPDFGDDAPIPPLVQPDAVGGAVMGHGGSSLGNSDHLVPPRYPRDSESTAPTLHLVKSTTHLRCRPTELYLGASTAQGQLSLNIFWDENVYTRDVVEEWLNEVRGATESFLGANEGEQGNTQSGTGGGIIPPVVVMAKL
ncbi:hypothetical protein C8R42DRAFT_37269 [Lentinula raphanica]|nr:hypothetical protein C8R42DRAFT_37269 [Lentinula raphanica]